MAVLLSAGPLLAYPDVLPANYRAGVVTVLVVVACAAAAVLLEPWRQWTSALWVFVLALVAGWATMDGHDPVTIRHFGGVGLGCLLLAVTAAWSRTEAALIQASFVFSLGALAAVAVGLAGTQVFPSKFVIGVDLVPETFYFWMPRLRLGLPGVADNPNINGYVNPNALGGTALLILPVCTALAGWALINKRWLLAVVPAAATLTAVAALTVTLSRTALLSTLLTALALGVWQRRTRRWVSRGLALIVILIVAQTIRAMASNTIDANWEIVVGSLVSRSSIWGSALEVLRAHPWLGTGINHFHTVVPSVENAGISYVAHAHNIFLQVALDVGVIGFVGYFWLIVALLMQASRTARGCGAPAWIAGGAGLSLVGVHLFGLADAIALGAKVGAFQWLSGGLILGAAALRAQTAVRPSSNRRPSDLSQ